MFKKLLSVLLVIGLLAIGKVASADFKTTFDAGYVKYVAGDYIGARADYRAALVIAKIDVDKATAQYYIGHSYEMEKDYIKARVEFAKVVNDAIYKAAAQWKIGCTYEAEGNTVEAEKAYIKVLVDLEFILNYGKLAFGGINWKKMASESKARLLLATFKNIPTPDLLAINSADIEVKTHAADVMNFKGRVFGDLGQLLGLPIGAGEVQAEMKIKELWN